MMWAGWGAVMTIAGRLARTVVSWVRAAESEPPHAATAAQKGTATSPIRRTALIMRRSRGDSCDDDRSVPAGQHVGPWSLVDRAPVVIAPARRRMQSRAAHQLAGVAAAQPPSRDEHGGRSVVAVRAAAGPHPLRQALERQVERPAPVRGPEERVEAVADEARVRPRAREVDVQVVAAEPAPAAARAAPRPVERQDRVGMQ